MKVIRATNGRLHDADAEPPVPRERDIVVRVEAVSVNPVDVKVRAGGGDHVLGYDAAGTVVETGSAVEHYNIGDEVYYAGDITRPGTNAELHAVDERIVGRKPRSLSFAEAASVPLTAITAWESLVDHLGAGPTTDGMFLVVGAPGGVGSILIQLTKHLSALTVIATAGREESAQWVRELGADHVVDHHELVAATARVAPDGVDHIFSAYSNGRLHDFATLIRPFGRVVAIDDSNPDVSPLKSKSASWHQEFMFARPMHSARDLDTQRHLLDRVAELIDAGIVRHTATKYVDGFHAAGLDRAHTLVADGTAIGKVVVRR